MFFHLGIPIFVSVINTGHLVASSGPSLHLDFDIEMWLNSSERSCMASHLAACVGMINVTNHLFDPKRSSLWPVAHHPPISCWLHSAPAPWIAFILLSQQFFSPTLLVHQQITGGTTMHFPCLQSSVRFFHLPDLSFQKYLLFGLVASEIHLCCECD